MGAATGAGWIAIDLGPTLERTGFRPRPRVDAIVLAITGRGRAMRPLRLAPQTSELLRPAWNEGVRSRE